MIFDEATQADAAALVQLVNAAYRAPGTTPGWTDERQLLEGARTSMMAVQADLARHRILVARPAPGGTMVACLTIAGADDGAWYLSAIAVDPAQQAGGIGAALLAEAERQARDAGVPRLRMTVIRQRETLIAWYERRGFRRTGETQPFPYGDPSVGRPLRDDLVLVVLAKELAPAGPPQEPVRHA